MFKVTIREEEVVAPVLPQQEHWLPMSNLDLLLPPLDVGLFFCYYNCGPGKCHVSAAVSAWTEDSAKNRVRVLKEGLARALVPFYAFAGEIVENSAGEPEILCNNRGVDFVEAFADVELREMNLYNPDESVEGKLVPKKKRGVFAVQATELKCGSLVVACSFDHRAADAFSANMFLLSWANSARGKTLTHLLPTFRRSILNPRRPAHVDPTFRLMYVPVPALPPPCEAAGDDRRRLISRIYCIKAEQLQTLQTLASSGGQWRTKLESFTAFLWKTVAKCSPESDAGKVCRVGIVVDGRKCLGDGKGKNVMESYFGNVLSVPFTGKKVGDLAGESLDKVAGDVHRCVRGAATAEHFLGLIDFVETLRPVPGVTRIYSYRSEDGPSFVVSSGQRFPVSEVDFGWGKPVFGSYHFPWGGDCGYVMPMPSTAVSGGRDWVVYMLLFGWQLEVIEKEASHVFKRLTFDYLVNNCDDN